MDEKQKNYSRLIIELKELEQKLEESKKESDIKEKEKQELEEYYDYLTNEIEVINKEKENMLDNNKIILIWKIVLLSIIGPTLLGYMYYAPFVIQTTLPDIYICKVILGCISILVAPSIISKYILRMVLKKRTEKTLKSNKYQKLQEKIKCKEEERKNIERKKTILFEESLQATLNYSTQNALVQIKREEIERIKNLVFNNMISNPVETEEKTKTFTRVKTRNENINSTSAN